MTVLTRAGSHRKCARLRSSLTSTVGGGITGNRRHGWGLPGCLVAPTRCRRTDFRPAPAASAHAEAAPEPSSSPLSLERAAPTLCGADCMVPVSYDTHPDPAVH